MIYRLRNAVLGRYLCFIDCHEKLRSLLSLEQCQPLYILPYDPLKYDAKITWIKPIYAHFGGLDDFSVASIRSEEDREHCK